MTAGFFGGHLGGLLLMGVFIGMRHALEADHLAALASLVGGNRSFAQTVMLGGVWGLGHTITLFFFGSIVLFMDTVMPDHLVKGLEIVVGLMLVLLGADVLRRVTRERTTHGVDRPGGLSHGLGAGLGVEGPQTAKGRERGFPVRALCVGLVHGMAGSAAVILLALETVTSPLRGMLYILMFGIGSMLGMSLLSAVISIPIQASAKRRVWTSRSLQSLIGGLTICVGLLVLYQHS